MAEVRPFHDLPMDSVVLRSLSVTPIGVASRVAESPVVSDWSVGTAVRVRGEFELQWDDSDLLEELGLAEGRLGGSLIWAATGTRLSGHLPGSPTPAGFTVDGVISQPIDGELRLRAVVTVLDGVADNDPLAPVLPGTTVWEARESFYLSGSGARFPMVAVSFRETGLGPQGALWHVQVDLHDLEADPSAALRLIINEDHPRREDLLLADHTDLVALLEWDIRRHVVESLLDDEDMSTLADAPAGTVGSFAHQCLLMALGHADLHAARNMRQKDRANFETRVRGGVLALPS